MLLLSSVLTLASAQLSLVFGGDVIPHTPVLEVAATHNDRTQRGSLDGWAQVLGPLSPVFKRNSLALVNLETPVVELKRPESGDLIFHAPPALARALKALGVGVATFANNHCLDQHPDGIASTRAFLLEAELASVGADVNEALAWTPLSLDIDGVRVGILAFTRFLNGFHNPKDVALPQVPLVPYASDKTSGGLSEKTLIDVVKTEASNHQFFIVIPHWGDEYQTKPKPEDRALAQRLIDAGADLIVGHHPHVVQPVEWLRRADSTAVPVAFSLGNLVSNQDAGNDFSLKREGLLLEVLVHLDNGKSRLQLNGVPIVTENQRAPGGRRNIQTVVVADEMASLQSRLNAITPSVLSKDKREAKLVAQRLKRLRFLQTRVHANLPTCLDSAEIEATAVGTR
jgi:Bacterial capsule synthesis protein PGA_cap